MDNIGKLIVGIGVVLIIVGLFVWLFADKLGWFGNLPGDIKIERPGFSLYIAIMTMLLISFGLSFVMWLISRFAR
jgi:Zn-dependent protease with chaperone function